MKLPLTLGVLVGTGLPPRPARPRRPAARRQEESSPSPAARSSAPGRPVVAGDRTVGRRQARPGPAL